MNATTGPLRERLAQTERDLVEIGEQLETGELDATTAGRLRTRYEAERRSLLDELNAAEVEAPSEDPVGLGGRRLLTIGLAMVVVIGVGIWLLVNTANGQSRVEEAADGVDLSEVSNEEMEAVVAQNPDVPGMRLALADRYFFAGEYSNALTHYMYVLDTLEVKDPDALANVAWMTFDSGFPELAESFAIESLGIQANNGTAMWYLANIRFYGLDDPQGALEPLERLLEAGNLPDELREGAQRLLTEVEASL